MSYLFRFGRSGRCVSAEPASALAWAGVAFPPFRRTAEAIRPTLCRYFHFSAFGPSFPLLTVRRKVRENPRGILPADPAGQEFRGAAR